MTNKFMAAKGRTVAYIRALKALRSLMAAQGSGAVSCAYAEVVADEHRESFAKSRGLTQSDGELCIQRLVGKRCNLEDCTPPAGDHDTLWLKDGKPALYLAQPYQLCWSEMLKLVEFCNRHGLEADVTNWPSFHYPGQVLSVAIKRAESNSQEQSGNNPGKEKS